MANLPESSSWDAGVYQIETTDAVVGGVNGISNAQAKSLANRTKWLRDWLESSGNFLARILAVDGAGSGIDADLLDGYHAASVAAPNTVPVRDAAAKLPGDVLGNASTATKLATSRQINGVNFDGTANITVVDTTRLPLAGGTVTGLISFSTAAADSSGSTGFRCNPNGWSRLDAAGSSLITTISAADVVAQRLVLSLQRADTWGHIWDLFADGRMLLANNVVWHAGNDGNGSGLDADFLRGLPADFSASLGISGWQKLPSGLIVQWGQASATAGGSGVAVTLPITFPTTILFGVASVANTGGNSGALAGGIRLDSQAQITVFNNGNQTATAIYWLVFGK